MPKQPSALVLLSILSVAGRPTQAKAALMPSATALTDMAEMLRRQVELELPVATLRTFLVQDTPNVMTTLKEV